MTNLIRDFVGYFFVTEVDHAIKVKTTWCFNEKIFDPILHVHLKMQHNESIPLAFDLNDRRCLFD